METTPIDDQPTASVPDETAEELYETAPCGYVTTSLDGRILKVNRTMSEWLGYEQGELTGGVRLLELLTVGGRMFYETHLSPMLRVGGAVNEIALDMIRKDGGVLPTLVNARQTRSVVDQPILNRLTIFNASERRMYERELLAARNLLRTTLVSIGDAVIAIDVEGRINFMNPVADELSGWKNNAGVGRPIEEVLVSVREETGARIANPIGEAIRSGVIGGLAEHTVLISKDGRRIAVDDSASPIKDESGAVVGGVLILRDISARREVERQLEETHDQIRRRADELRRSNEDLSQFAHVASHDLRSPLSTITRYVQLLDRTYGNDLGEGRELLEYVSDAAKRMSSLIDDLLEYAHVSAEGIHSSAPVDPNVQLQTVLDNLQDAISASGAIVTHDVLPEVLIDPTSLVQLLQNLIGNAIHYRSADPPRIHITATDQNRRVLFCCRDNGIGIAPEYQAQIFEPFKRLHGSDRPGSGIGLAVCKKIAERYNGRIWVESEVNHGSAFFLTLPKA